MGATLLDDPLDHLAENVEARRRAETLDDRWDTLMTGTLADGSETLSGLAERLDASIRTAACRMVHGIATYDPDAVRLDRDRDLILEADIELGGLLDLEAELERTIESRVKAFAMGILEARAAAAVAWAVTVARAETVR